MRTLLSAFFVMVAILTSMAVSGAPLSESELQAAALRVDAALMKAREEEEKRTDRYGPLRDLPGRADDEVFLRRACIDLAGRLPAPDEVRQFVADAGASKRAGLVDRLLAEPGAAEARFQGMAEALRIQDQIEGRPQARFIVWLREAMAEDMPYDQLMSVMLRAQGDPDADPAAPMLQRDGQDLLHTSTELARAFLGADLHCARCHNHPFTKFTQKQAHEFAACFVPPGGPPVRLPARYLYNNGKPGEEVLPKYLPLVQAAEDDPQNALAAQPVPVRNLRDQLALWFTGPQNTRFAEVGALRLWHVLFGLTPANSRHLRERPEWRPWREVVGHNECGDQPPPWTLPTQFQYFDAADPSAAVAAVLGAEFQRAGYRQREFLRILARTEAYQREAVESPDSWRSGLEAAPRLRRLPPQVTWDSWAGWLPEGDADAKATNRLPQPPDRAHPLHLLGQGTREWADETAPVISHGVAAFMMGSPLVERIAATLGQVSAGTEPARQVEHLFLTTLGRLPEVRESAAALDHLARHPQSGSQDIAWALLNTSEFLFEP